MARTLDIAEFNLSDGLTPRQTDKLNHNFRNLLRLYHDFEEVVVDNSVIEEMADYIVESGVSNGWAYQLYKSGYIDAWCTVGFDLSTSGYHSEQLTLPKVMADTSYAITVDAGIWIVDKAYCITANNTTSTAQVAVYNSTTDASAPSTTSAVMLKGFVAS